MKQSHYRKPESALVEQRVIPRKKVAIQRTAISSDDLNPIDAHIQDISVYGCCLAVDAILPEKEIVEIAFENGETAEAVVVWQERNRMGCRFVNPIDADLFEKMTIKG